MRTSNTFGSNPSDFKKSPSSQFPLRFTNLDMQAMEEITVLFTNEAILKKCLSANVVFVIHDSPSEQYDIGLAINFIEQILNFFRRVLNIFDIALMDH